jgi:signal transduction histidine kinase
VELVIEDSGCGIPLELLDKLFEPFFTTKPVGKGIGIGLSTCYSIVKKHNGEITVTSTVGVGSAFRVSLPGMEQP